MEILRKINDLVKTGKWYYCQEEDGKIIYTDSCISWTKWAEKTNRVRHTCYGLVGDRQYSVVIEFMPTDIEFARTKTPDWGREFYRVTALGGRIDGRTRGAKTLEEAFAIQHEWGVILGNPELDH